GAADGDGELETRGETKLFEDARQMCLDRLDGDRESGSDVLVARAGGDEAHELAFTRRQLLGAGDGGRQRRGAQGEVLDEPDHDAAADPDLDGLDALDGSAE